MRVAIIPARGGSKRIPRKNVKKFHGKPMIAWQIKTALDSNLFERVVVSTDDPEIADVSVTAGAQVPFIRPKELSDDHTVTAPVIAHALKFLAETGQTYDSACCIYACAAFTRAYDLKAAFALFEKTQAKFCYPVVPFPHPPQRAMRRLSSGDMQFVQAKNELTRTQDLEPLFHDAGQFYWGRHDAWINGIKMHSNGVGFEMKGSQLVDIDTPDDWERAEIIFELGHTRGH